ncbi:hypothetical protein SA2016_1487 [Sinomonas atrocyanea]|uniref:Rhamnosyltransferase n=1 Tax=Sinomonas atrocyanea TaxID=37927 RepID=A0A127A025_9MICC|nr:glycosyltransferase [Sinomonas atrocyanea]AMM32164.1 hypothetical protein SA2016_1487 [Sinomonas atrocyanea]GEB64764.1 hypothetical protein SAT01_22120 [Sinomonas atrocyanea]GGG67019.1 hypothetical protein GCM10007172_18460 [Sinomonas atrocyanea]
MTGVDHVVLTRFNLPSAGYEKTVRTRDGWLESRVGLFERYCLPSVLSQSCQDFAWLVYFDPESPSWLMERIARWSGSLTPLFRREVLAPELIADLRAASGGGGGRLLTTNLDNDDALSSDFVERVQAAARSVDDQPTAIYLAHGLIAAGERLYRRHDPANAFCSVAAPWAAQKTCWSDWHNHLGRSMPVVLDRGGPGWLQVVHGANVSNRVHGVLTAPAVHTRSFPGLLDDLRRPRTRDRLLDGTVRQPARIAREALRGAVKSIVVAFGGRDALDRVRTRARIRGPRGGLSGRRSGQ